MCRKTNKASNIRNKLKKKGKKQKQKNTVINYLSFVVGIKSILGAYFTYFSPPSSRCIMQIVVYVDVPDANDKKLFCTTKELLQ